MAEPKTVEEMAREAFPPLVPPWVVLGGVAYVIYYFATKKEVDYSRKPYRHPITRKKSYHLK